MSGEAQRTVAIMPESMPRLIDTLNAPRRVDVGLQHTFIRNKGSVDFVEVHSPQEVVVLEDLGSNREESAVIVDDQDRAQGVSFSLVVEQQDGSSRSVLAVNDVVRNSGTDGDWRLRSWREASLRFDEARFPLQEEKGYFGLVVNDQPMVLEVGAGGSQMVMHRWDSTQWVHEAMAAGDERVTSILRNAQVVASIDEPMTEQMVSAVESGNFEQHAVSGQSRRIERTFAMAEKRAGNPDVQAHIETIRGVTADTLNWAFYQFEEATGQRLSPQDRGIMEMWLMARENDYADALRLSRVLALRAEQGKRVDPTRSVFENPQMMAMAERARNVILPTAYIFVLGGLTLESQRGGLKKLYGMDGQGLYGQHSDVVNDVLGSATALNLGAQHPLLVTWKMAAEVYGIGSNFCMPYHPAVNHVLAAEQMASEWKNGKMYVQTEGSGTMVNNWAITSAVAYATREVYGTFARWDNRAERQQFLQEVAEKDPVIAARLGNGEGGWEDLALLEATGHVVTPKVFMSDGTWCGGAGPSQEGTAFGTDAQVWHHGGPRWVRRDLPLPTLENKELYLSTVEQAIAAGELAGVILEPIVGDAGIYVAHPEVVDALVELLRKGYNGKSLPLIVDTIQQGAGRTGRLWGTEHLPSVENYPLTVVTGGKSLGGGDPFGLLMMPEAVANATYPLSTITTNSYNGGFMNAALVMKYLSDERIQGIIDRNAQVMEDAAGEFGMELRGMRMNRALETGSPEGLELIMWQNLLKNGILVGALPSAVRFQPMLLEHPDTIRAVTRATCQVVMDVKSGNIPDYVLQSYKAAANQRSGLNR